MKQIYLILSLTLLSLIVYSQQEYYPIPEENVYWTVTEFNYGNGLYNDFLYTVNGDTIVNGLLYKKVYKLEDSPKITDTITVLHCLMRQDSAQKKVWFIRTYLGDTSELLGYDLDVEIGDTVTLEAFNFGITQDPRFVVQNIEDIDLQYLGEMEGIRKYYWLNNATEIEYNIEYIEGIVNYSSVFPNLEDTLFFYDAFHQTYTWCMQQDGIYGFAQRGDNEPPSDYCGFLIIDDVDKIDVSEQIKISPNPANSYLIIEIPQNLSEVNSLSLYNLPGQIIQSVKPDKGSKNILFNVSHLKNGIYLLHINMTDMVAAKKIIVSH